MELACTARNRFFAAMVVSVAMILSGGTTAGAATPARSSLTLTVGPAPYFVVGDSGSVEASCSGAAADDYSFANVALYLHATAKGSPITGYDVAEVDGAGPSDPVHSTTSPNPLSWTADDDDGSCGCGQCDQVGWQISVDNDAGQSVTKNEYYYFRLVRWNNGDVGGNGETSDSWAFSRGWATSTCACADGGTMTKTATSGVYGSYLANVIVKGEHLGLMMATGPTRGRADIYVDGSFATTIDTYAASNTNRVYTWDSGPLGKGQHTIKVVNEATNGRPNIYINGMSELHGCPTFATYNC